MRVALCNSEGATLLGSDGHINVDGRLKPENVKREVRKYRERFKANFRHKYDHWTHFYVNSNSRTIKPID